ncbi:MAG: choice-of-anchor D domain-containing protein [Chryseolinea sp.]
MKKTSTLKNGIVIPLLICFLIFQISSFCEASGTNSIRSSKDGAPIAKITEGYESIDFGNTYVGQWQWPIYIYIENIGTEPLIISTIHSSSPDFVLSEFSGPVTVAPMERYDLFVGFNPSAVGNRTSNIEIFSNDPVNPILVAHAAGVGFEPPIADSVFSGMSFSNQQTSKILTLKNATPLDLHNDIILYLVNNRSDHYEYSIQIDLASGETTELEIPINTNNLPPGKYTGELIINSGYELRFSMDAEWLVLKEPEIYSGTLTNFDATILVGQEIPEGNWITIGNFNDIPLAYTVTKKYPDLDFIAISPTAGALPNGKYTHLLFNYNAKNLPVGTYHQEFQITIDNPELTIVSLEVTVHVIASGPILGFYDYQINRDFDRAWIGSTNGPICFTVTNAGTEPLIISKVISTNPDFSVLQADSTVLPPFDNSPENYFFPCIQFSPSSVGPISGEVLIYSNDPITPIRRIQFNGIGVPSPVVQTYIHDTLLSNQKSTHVLTLQNKTSEPVEYEVNSYYSGFVKDFTTIVALAPGESKDIAIEFNAEGLPGGQYFGDVYILSEGGYLNARVDLELNVLGTINDLSLIYFKTNTVASTPFWNLDVADPDLEKYTIRADVTDQKIGSVKFTIDGRTINTDNTKPYTLNHWELPVLSAGQHYITAQAFSKRNGHGDSYELFEAWTFVSNSATITQFDVVDINGNVLKTLVDGDVINMGQPEFQHVNIIARTNINTIRSVKFTLNGITARIDNRAPYAVSGASNGNEMPWNIKPGTYELTATPYMKYYAWGPVGVPMTVHFTVVNNATTLAGLSNWRESSELNTELQFLESEKHLVVYPNPVIDELHIGYNNISESNFELRILNTNGQIVYHVQGDMKTLQEENISTKQLGLASGMYYVQLISTNGSVEIKKITKQ